MIVPNLVSTIIPVYNRPQMLREAVQSVLDQTWPSVEVLIADDGSTDDETPRVGEELERTHPGVVKFLRKENSGPGPTRELGRQHARGEFIQYLDSDDLLRPRKFELMVNALREHPECGAAYGFICVHPLNSPPPEKPYKGSGLVRETLFPWLLADRWWNTDCPLFRRSVCDEIGPWSDLRWSQDWEYDGRVAALGTKLVHVADWVCDERHHTTGRQTDTADWLQPERIRHRKRFMEMMLGHAERGGVDEFTPQRQHFTRFVFTTARHAAAGGLVQEAKELLELAERAAGNCREVKKGFLPYRVLSNMVGWRFVGWLFRHWEKFRRPGSGFTLRESFAQDLQRERSR
ncbi:MAG: glycosyltransferase family 2 protein [Planctomycetaceae bacterium]|nr:glycosyltransferase family 2 protein [Planctomycetaceae bacterium]MCA9043374.1 glycosyltransferase family 2 protein [Planctomycetaceae bacterium]MCB9952043.1 glycosyltransferase family 2 protein [Planctomycetaceae bacterium]